MTSQVLHVLKILVAHRLKIAGLEFYVVALVEM